jgi:hypothetical protein
MTPFLLDIFLNPIHCKQILRQDTLTPSRKCSLKPRQCVAGANGFVPLFVYRTRAHCTAVLVESLAVWHPGSS